MTNKIYIIIYRLTGFVMKSYLQAQKHMYIDNKEIESVIAWIMKQQRHDGSFPIIGKANNKYIQVTL